MIQETTMQKTVFDLEDGEIGRAKDGRHWINKGGSIWNEFQATYARDWNEVVEVLTEKPRLIAGGTFFYRGPKNLTPNNILMFELACGWRFKCFLSVDYKFSIPFWFYSSDSRVGMAESKWHCDTGMIFRHLCEATFGLQIIHDNDGKVLLGIDKCTSHMIVPSKTPT